jgi:hypothetical protein
VVRKSYGGPNKKDAYIFYKLYPDNEFSENIRKIANFITDLPEGSSKPVDVLENIIKQIKRS